jgi:hypothetical protein
MRGLLRVKGERPKTNKQSKKKDHENNKTKYEIRAPEPKRTIEHGKTGN